jgi:hypothetical protein
MSSDYARWQHLHESPAWLHIGCNNFLSVQDIWQGIERAERAGIALDDISAALDHGCWTGTICALAEGDIVMLRQLIAEAHDRSTSDRGS